MESLVADMSDGKHGAAESGAETPSLADHSGNNTPAGARKSKVNKSSSSQLRSHNFLPVEGSQAAGQAGAQEVWHRAHHLGRVRARLRLPRPDPGEHQGAGRPAGGGGPGARGQWPGLHLPRTPGLGIPG